MALWMARTVLSCLPSACSAQACSPACQLQGSASAPPMTRCRSPGAGHSCHYMAMFTDHPHGRVELYPCSDCRLGASPLHKLMSRQSWLLLCCSGLQKAPAGQSSLAICLIMQHASLTLVTQRWRVQETAATSCGPGCKQGCLRTHGRTPADSDTRFRSEWEVPWPAPSLAAGRACLPPSRLQGQFGGVR